MKRAAVNLRQPFVVGEGYRLLLFPHLVAKEEIERSVRVAARRSATVECNPKITLIVTILDRNNRRPATTPSIAILVLENALVA